MGMIDKRQIIYDIERCICHVPDACIDCSHYTGTGGFGCMEELMSDTLFLLKEQEKRKLRLALDIAKRNVQRNQVGRSMKCGG